MKSIHVFANPPILGGGAFVTLIGNFSDEMQCVPIGVSESYMVELPAKTFLFCEEYWPPSMHREATWIFHPVEQYSK